MDKLITEMARAMHLSAHPTADPDDTIMMLKGEMPRWRIYEHMARAILPIAFEHIAKLVEGYCIVGTDAIADHIRTEALKMEQGK